MKIAIFSDNFYPEISGISDSVILLGQKLQDMGHEVHYFAPKYSKKNYQMANVENKELELGKNIKIHRLWSLPFFESPTNQARFVIPLGLLAWKFRREKFDLIHTQSPFGLGIEALLMSRFLGIPLLGTNHTPIEEFTCYIPIFGKIMTTISKRYFSCYYNQCSFITTPYQGLLEDMRNNGLRTENQVLSNPIDLKNFISVSQERKKELKSKYKLSDSVVIYSGRLAQEKHVDVIVRAMLEVRKSFPTAMFVITGIGSAEADLKKLVSKLGLAESVRFFGRVDEQTHIELYQASEIFAIMSTAEAQSLSLMKAMAVGMPVIGADARALPEYIKPNCGFIVQAGDIQNLTEKNIFLLKSVQQRKTLGENGQLFVSQFSASAVARKWEGIYKKAQQNQKKNNLIKKSMKLSIVIPAYNEEKYIGRCLQSVLAQIETLGGRRNIEVIVVNNASVDATAEIAGEFAGVLVVEESERGLTKARQAGFDASTGELIANVDADSKLPAGWIEKVFSEFEKNEKLVALSGPFIYNHSSRLSALFVWFWYRVGQATHFVNQYILKNGAMLQGGNFILRRSALEKIGGYNTSIDFWGEDTDIARRISKVGRVKFTFKLPMITSPRRFRKDGFLVAAWKYLINYVWVLFSGKPFLKEYEEIE